MSLGARRLRSVAGPLVAVAALLTGCLHGLASLTSEQEKGLGEAQRIADRVTKGYGVPGVRIYAVGLEPGTGGRYTYHHDWIFVRPEMLTGPRFKVLISHELGHVTLRHGAIDGTVVQPTAAGFEHERAANRRGVEILMKYLELSEQEALNEYATFFIQADRFRHGQEVLMPFGHLRPCEELKTLWEDFGKPAPPCGEAVKR